MLKAKKIIQRPYSEISALRDLHPVLQRIYAARGITQPEQLETDMHSLFPYQDLMEIDKAVTRLYQALVEKQRILIVGDFDADGATSSAIAVKALTLFKAHCVDFLVPNRFEYGYGLTPELVKDALRYQPDLIVTVDNGISSIEGVRCANDHNIDVIITDHHLPGEHRPDAVAIINPNQHGCTFASKNLAGCGVIFYTMIALRRYLIEQDWFAKHNIAQPNMGSLLDLVALGTIADVVPLDQNNRTLVFQGLQRIRRQRCSIGIKALLTVAKRDITHLSATDLAFSVAPRLNAAGRLDDMSIGIRCLLSEDESEAMSLAQTLDDLNIERRNIEKSMQQQAAQVIQTIKPPTGQTAPYAFALYEPDWHQGVVGIVAGRIKEKWHRPTFAFANESAEMLKGSGRSIPGLHLRDILAQIDATNPGLITKFGGHAMAAGLSFPKKNLARFRQQLQTVVASKADENTLAASLLTDGQLAAEDFSLPLAQLLREAGPWGQNFPEPLFEGEFQLVDQRLLRGNHLKCSLRPLDSQQCIDAIAFNVDNELWPNHRCERVKVVYKLDINHFRGVMRLQLMIDYIEPILVTQSQSLQAH